MRWCAVALAIVTAFVLLHKHKARAGQSGPILKTSGSRFIPVRDTASWYGPGFVGRKTATGETFDDEDLTAASLVYPLHSMIRVTNPKNGKSVVVRINDRGPYVKGRSIDLSRKAADILGIIKHGVAPVTLSMADAADDQDSQTVDVTEQVDGDNVRLEVAHVQPGIHPDSSPMLGKLASAGGATAGRVARMLAASYGEPQESRSNPLAYLMVTLMVGLAIVGQLSVRMRSLSQLGPLAVTTMGATPYRANRRRRLRSVREASPDVQVRRAIRRPGPAQRAPFKWRVADEAWQAQREEEARRREEMRRREGGTHVPFANLDDSWSKPSDDGAHSYNFAPTIRPAEPKVEVSVVEPQVSRKIEKGTGTLRRADTGILKEPPLGLRWIRYGMPGNSIPLEINGDLEMEPGVYYGGVTINAGACVKMKPGLFIMAGGSLKLRSASVDTTGVKIAYVPADLPTVEFDSLGFAGTDPVVLRPGIYFGDVTVPQYLQVDVLPGLYVVASGQFSVPAAHAADAGVTVYSL